MKLLFSPIPVVLCVVFCCSAQSPSAGALEQMPKPLETRFALSALPPHLRNEASVHLLDPKVGYLLEKKGTNGFTCIVERTEWARADFRDDVYTALCYDAEGSKNHLRVYMDVAAMRAKGLTAGEVKAQISKRFASKTYQEPKRAGLSYMVAPLMRTYINPDPSDKTVFTVSMPHHMIYAPNLTDKDIGGMKPPSPYPFTMDHGPHGYMIIMLGKHEQAQILEASKELLGDLCAYRKSLCLDPSAGH